MSSSISSLCDKRVARVPRRVFAVGHLFVRRLDSSFQPLMLACFW